MPSNGKKLIKLFKFTNSNNSFQLLIPKLDSLGKDSLIIVHESTVHYDDNLVNILLLRITKCVLNSINASTMRKNNICKTKTDKIDTYIICKTLMMQESLRSVTFYTLGLMDLKTLDDFVRKELNIISFFP